MIQTTRERATHIVVLLYAALGPLLVLRGLGENGIGAADLLLLPALFLVVTLRSSLIPAFAWLYLGFIGCAAATAIGAVLVDGSFAIVIQVVRLLAIFVPFLLVSRLPSLSGAEFSRIVKSAYFGGLIAVVIGIAFYYLGIEMRDEQQRIWLGNGQGSIARASGLLGNTGDYGHLSAIWGLTAILLSQLAFQRGRVLAMASGVVFTGWSLVLSASRGAFIHVLVGLLIGLPLLLRVSRSVRIAIPSMLGALVLWSTPIIPADLLPTSGFIRHSWLRLDLFNISGESKFFNSVRFANWREISRSINDQPFFGTGLKQFTVETGTFIDNSYLAALVEVGIIGGALFILYWLVLTVRLIRQSSSSRHALAALALVVSELAHATTLDTFRLWYSMPLTFLLIAACMKRDETMRAEGPSTIDLRSDVGPPNRRAVGV